MRRIAINTGGGDAPGLNAVIRAVVRSACARGWEVLGIRHGYRGILESDPSGLIQLTEDTVSGIAHLGGTILGSTNRGDPFQYPVLRGDTVVAEDASQRLVGRFKELGIEALIALGGDGSIQIAKRLLDQGLPRVIAVPKTIDNDLPATDVTFGFDTAVCTATEAIDKLHSTAEAHERVLVVELMGRYAGWIALHAGVAGGADVILIPEIPFDISSVCEKVKQRERAGRGFSIVVAAEGASSKGEGMLFKAAKDRFAQHAQLGGIAERVARDIHTGTGKETRSLVLGHLQRGGGPIASDRILAARLGTAAVGFVEQSTASGMVAMRNNETILVPLEQAAGITRRVPADSGLVASARNLGICFGDEPAGTFG